MKFGYFDDKHREYVITRPDTPLPWINYLGSQEYFGLISNTAGGYSFYRDARLRRLTRYRYNNVPLDTGGRYIYMRDNQEDYFWSPTWQPTRSQLDSYECRHGMGYTSIHSTYTGIETHTRYFVPLDANLEIWQVEVTNQRDTAAQLSLFSCIEFCLWDAHDDATNFQRNFNTGEVEIEDSVIYHKTEYRERRNHFAFFACSEPLVGYDTQRSDFLGAYRGWDTPLVVENGQSKNSEANGWSPIGSHHIQISLQPGETRSVIFLLGYHENPPDNKFDPPRSQRINKRSIKPIIKRFLNPPEADAAFESLKASWQEVLNLFQVNTPDEHTDRMVNIWNAYQCMVTFNLSRSASYFESGIGRGMGFRDSNQDLLGFVHMIPERGRQRILDLAATQLHSGGAFHQYQPLTKCGNNDVGSDFNDDPAWLVLAVAAYIKETGDWNILDESVPYENQIGSEQPLYHHLQSSIEYTLSRLGPHGLPLIGRADWNDCLNLNCFSETSGEAFQTTTNKEGLTAESVFIGGQFVLAAGELEQIARLRGRQVDAARYRQAADQIRSAVEQDGWDENWFLRAYDDFGDPLGSHKNEEGQIFIEPQGMCVMAGIGLEDGRALQALDAVHQRLATPHGIVLHHPAYTRYYLNLGEISTYPPGYKENGGVFCHNNPWIMIAETLIGRGDRAHDYYSRINPSRREKISELHTCEPYVYAQMIAGAEARAHGEAKNSWLTGTAAWNYVAITQWILGIRPTYQGLQIDPCIPPEWDGYTVQRTFRGCRYEIEVQNPSHISKGLHSVSVDGAAVEGVVLPHFEDGQLHHVCAIMG
jgi:cellobiose phosphorylase